MDVLLNFISVVISLLLVPALFLLPIAGYLRSRRKGYRPPGATLVLFIGSAVGILSAYVVVSAFPSVEKAFQFFFWLPVLVLIAVTSLLIRVLPRRNPRVSGPRRPHFPFAAVGWALNGLPAILVIFVWWVTMGKPNDSDSNPLGKSIQLWVTCSLFGAYLISLSRRVKAAASIEEIARNDLRAPVLYLRPFNQERSAFVWGPKSRYGDYVRGIQRFLMTRGEYWFVGDNDANPDPIVGIRFEEYLGSALTARIGPFFALGNPEDYTPPEGAARTYVQDTDWKEHVKRLAGKSSCIVAEVASSDNLRWELEYLRQEGLQQKLFVITRPLIAKTNWLANLLIRLNAVRRPDTWPGFAENLGRLGYEIPSDPGVGAVMAFDASGKGVTLTTGALLPGDYVEPIRTFIIDSLGYSPEQLDPPHGPEPESAVAVVPLPKKLWQSIWAAMQKVFLLYKPGRKRAWIPYAVCWLTALFLFLAAFGGNLKDPGTYSFIQMLLLVFLVPRLSPFP